MELVLTKSWGIHKKNDKLFINDQSVIDKGLSIGLFVTAKKPKVKNK